LNVGDRPINLTQVLKLAGLVSNGGEGKALIAEGMVRVNGEVELRKRRQMTLGDVVQIEGGPGVTLVSLPVLPPPA
jgi:ribosome-associated protein